MNRSSTCVDCEKHGITEAPGYDDRLVGAAPLNPAPLTFTLTITLGNDAMSTPANVCDALSDVIDRVDFYSEFPAIGVEGTIRDANGNPVGSWAVN